jgi:hypothetical protein
MEKSINLSYYTLYDNINSFNTFCETFWLIHTAKTVICIAASVTAEIATTLTRPRSRPRPFFRTLAQSILMHGVERGLSSITFWPAKAAANDLAVTEIVCNVAEGTDCATAEGTMSTHTAKSTCMPSVVCNSPDRF